MQVTAELTRTHGVSGASSAASPSRKIASLVRAVALTVVGAALTAVVAYLALDTAAGQRWDNRAMLAIAAPTDVVLQMLRGLSTVSVATTGIAMGICMLAALMRGRWALAVAAAVLVTGANVTTQLLKYVVLDRADLGVPSSLYVPNSLPSGHTTVVVSLSLAAVIVAPKRLRALAILGASAMSTLVGVSVILGRWHRPSDVVAAIGVCLAWSGVALLVATLLTRRHPTTGGTPHHSSALFFWLVSLLGPALVAIVVDRLGLYAIGSFRTGLLGALGLLAIGFAAMIASGGVGLTADRLDPRRRY